MKIKSLLLGAVAALSMASFFGASAASNVPPVIAKRISSRRRSYRSKIPQDRRPPSVLLRQRIAKEREIGVNPKYRNRRSENGPAVQLAWALKSREWNKAHGGAAL
jgi:hypothetical protein